MLAETAERLPGKTAFVCGQDRISFGELREAAVRVASGLSARGLGRGDRAAVYMVNSIELVIAFYALQRLGVVVAWINPRYRDKEALFILRDSGSKAAFVFETWDGFGYTDWLVGGAGAVPGLQTIVSARSRATASVGTDPRVLSFERLLHEGAGAPPPAAPVSPDDLCMLVYTSGTTGQPKGVMTGQSQAVRTARAYALGTDATEDDVFLGFLPMTHSYGCGAVLMQPVLLGATVVLMEEFSARAALDLIQRERVTLQPGAPAHYLLELKHLAEGSWDLGSLRAGSIAGQIAPPGLLRRAREEMGVYLYSFLGSSETGPSLMFPYGTELALRESSLGIPIPETAARVVDPVTGADVPDGEPGELLLSGWHVLRGYWQRPEETARSLRGGWLHTGDLVAREATGCLRVLGRLKEWINRGGFKIIPSEIEALLADHPKIAEVCAVPTPNSVLGESLCVCARLHDPGVNLTLVEVREYLRNRVADFKLPDELLVVEDFPRLSGGLKVKRFGVGGVAELAAGAQDRQTLR
jgi:acyl-CoA synthetase (AMP-forming)/AMP-acid ligase II